MKKPIRSVKKGKFVRICICVGKVKKPTEGGEVLRISFSSIDTFEFCPIRYYFRYILGEKQPTNDFVVLGQMFHEAMGKIPELGFDATKQTFLANIEEWRGKVDSSILSMEEFANYVSNGFTTMEKALTDNNFKHILDLENGAIEREYEANLGRQVMGEDAFLVGRVDFLKSDVLIDFKFKKHFKYLNPFQLGIYKKLANYNGERMGFFVFTWSGDYDFVQMRQDDEQTDRHIAIFIEEVENRRANNHWTANLKRCKICPFKEKCNVSSEETFYEF